MFEIIINPNAGKGKSIVALAELEKRLSQKNIKFNIHKTERAKHATEIAEKLTENGAKLIVLGGDGTFNEVLNGIKDFENTTVGFVPCGTGNDYVKATAIPISTSKAIDNIINGRTGYTDYIQMNGTRCLNVAGGGMDTDVLVRYSEMKFLKGKIKYFASLISVLLHLRFHKVKISVDDGEDMEKSVFLISIANGKYIGGGMAISPMSKVDDGLLNVVVVNEIKPSKVLSLLISFLNGKHIKKPCCEEFLCKKARLEMLDDGKVQADGEILDKKILECEIRHNELKIYI